MHKSYVLRFFLLQIFFVEYSVKIHIFEEKIHIVNKNVMKSLALQQKLGKKPAKPLRNRLFSCANDIDL